MISGRRPPWTGILGRLFPSRCLICGRAEPGLRLDKGCCPECLQELGAPGDGFCPECGLLFASSDSVSLCLECRQQPKPWSGFGFFGPYRGLLRELLLKYKFQGRFGYTRLLQSLLIKAYAEHLAPFQPDLVLPVPMPRSRLSARGFNQSLELGKGVAASLGVRISSKGLARRAQTPPQTGLDKKERRKNVRGVFAANQDLVHGKKILLVDDIYTTGATLTACARALLQSRAERVAVLVLARAMES